MAVAVKVYIKTKSSTDLDNSVSELDVDGYGDEDNSVFVRSIVFPSSAYFLVLVQITILFYKVSSHVTPLYYIGNYRVLFFILVHFMYSYHFNLKLLFNIIFIKNQVF